MSFRDEISIEELIGLANKATDNERITDVGEFILDQSVRPSDTEKVDAQVIYWIYCKWCKEKRKVPLTRRFFLREWKTRFQPSGFPVYYYKVASEPFDISTEEWFQMRKAFRHEVQKGKDKKAKKQSEKSRS